MLLSVIVPSIRVEKLPALYKSIQESYSQEFEFIVVSPCEPVPEIMAKPNVQWIHDWGSPLCCQQIGLIHAKGDYITRAVDDGTYILGGLDTGFRLIEPHNYMRVACLKFVEGSGSAHKMYSNEFYSLSYHIQTLRPYVPYSFKLLNFYIISTKLLKEIGGWDCETFESIAIGELDMSIRIQWHGAKVSMHNNLITVMCEWMPGEQGDHKPMHTAFADDMAKYNEIYKGPECEDREIIDINNWQKAPERWERRFGK